MWRSPRLLDALTRLLRGDWEAAHEIAQVDTSADGAWLHGIAHLVEGDRANAGYWFAQAGRSCPPSSEIDAEIRRFSDHLAETGVDH